jgi:hypothetical protein
MNYLIAACSGTKRTPSAATMPAIELYDGPAWRIIRKAAEKYPTRFVRNLSVYVLSAEYGLVPAGAHIAPYDRKLDADRAEFLQAKVERQGLAHLSGMAIDPHPNLLVAGGRLYADLAFHALPNHDDMMWRCSCDDSRGIGDQLSELKTWLEAVLS